MKLIGEEILVEAQRDGRRTPVQCTTRVANLMCDILTSGLMEFIHVSVQGMPLGAWIERR